MSLNPLRMEPLRADLVMPLPLPLRSGGAIMSPTQMSSSEAESALDDVRVTPEAIEYVACCAPSLVLGISYPASEIGAPCCAGVDRPA